MSAEPVITRFAPSPTGYIHLGNCRTALFSYLWMLNSRLQGNKGSKFILRIEDTDRERSKDEYTVALCEDLAALGIKWDVGPDPDASKEAKRSPEQKREYTQSLRGDIYQKYYDELLEKGLAYPCFCSDAALKMTRKKQLAAGQPPRYSGTCRSLSPEDIKKRLDAGETPVLRFKVADDAVIEFEDRVKGKQKFLGKHIGDFVIRKSFGGGAGGSGNVGVDGNTKDMAQNGTDDGAASFMFANAIDDALMGVNLVVRGDDHISNTPNQMLILQALGLPIPDYAHISMVVGTDGKPLSKRNGNCNIRELFVDYSYPMSGKSSPQWECLPIGVINYLARLGHSYESGKLENIESLGKHFKPQTLSSSTTLWDPNSLTFWQSEAFYKTLEEIVAQEGDGEGLSEEARGISEHFKKLLADKSVTGGKHYDFNHLVYTIIENAPTLSRASHWVKHMCSYGLSSAQQKDGRPRQTYLYIINQRSIEESSNIKYKEIYDTAIEVIQKMPDGDIELLMKSWKDITKEISEATGLTGRSLFGGLRVALTGSNFGPPLDRIYALIGKEEAIKRLQIQADESLTQTSSNHKL